MINGSLAQRKGFSVYELLVVLAVSGLLIGALFTLLNEDTQINLTVEDQQKALWGDRRAIDMIVSDMLQAGNGTLRVPESRGSTAMLDAQPSYELLGPDFVVFNADISESHAARDTSIAYTFSSGTFTLPGPGLAMSRADAKDPMAGSQGYTQAETIAYYLGPDPEPYGTNPCTRALFRRINDEPAQALLRGVHAYDPAKPQCNDLPRIPVGPLFTYRGFFECSAASGTCDIPQLYGDADNNGTVSPSEIADLFTSASGPSLRFFTGRRVADNTTVLNSECTTAAGGACTAYNDINGNGKVDLSLDGVVASIDVNLVVESSLVSENLVSNEGYIRSQLAAKVTPGNPPTRGFGCRTPGPENVGSLSASPDDTQCSCGRSVILRFPPSADDPYLTGGQQDVMTYNIYQRVVGFEDWARVAAAGVVSTSQYEAIVTGLDPSKSYEFRVLPEDCSGLEPTNPDAAPIAQFNPSAAVVPCAGPVPDGYICETGHIRLTWGFAANVPLGLDFVIQYKDNADNWQDAALHPDPAESDIRYDEQNGVAGTQMRGGDCTVQTAAKGEDCYKALVVLPDGVGSVGTFRVLPPGSDDSCLCGGCPEVTVGDDDTPAPVCEVQNVCSEGDVLNVVWKSHSIEECSGESGKPRLISYRVYRNLSVGTLLSDPPTYLDDANYLLRRLEEDFDATGACPPPPPIGCLSSPLDDVDAKGVPASSNLGYPEPVDVSDANTGCPDGITGDPSSTEIEGEPLDRCAIGDPINTSRGLHNYILRDHGNGFAGGPIVPCEQADYTVAMVYELSDGTTAYQAGGCSGTAIPQLTDVQLGSEIVSGFPVPGGDAWIGPVDAYGPAYASYDYDIADARHSGYAGGDEMCQYRPSYEPSEAPPDGDPVANDPNKNFFHLAFKNAPVSSALFSSAAVTRREYPIESLPMAPNQGNLAIIDTRTSPLHETAGIGFHDRYAPDAKASRLDDTSTALASYPSVPNGFVRHKDRLSNLPPADTIDLPDFEMAYHYRVQAENPAQVTCGTDLITPLSCAYAYVNYIPARPEPVLPHYNGRVPAAGFPAVEIGWSQDSTPPPVPGIRVDTEEGVIEVHSLSRSDCSYNQPDECHFDATSLSQCSDQPVAYMWFRRVCDPTSTDPEASCKPLDPYGTPVDLVQNWTNANLIFNDTRSANVDTQDDVAMIWQDFIIDHTDSSGGPFNPAGGLLRVTPECNTEEEVYYYTFVAVRMVKGASGGERLLLSDPSPLVRFDCPEPPDCGPVCDFSATNLNTDSDNWGLTCLQADVNMATAGVQPPTSHVTPGATDVDLEVKTQTYTAVLSLKKQKLKKFVHITPKITFREGQSDFYPAQNYEWTDQTATYPVPLLLVYRDDVQGTNDLQLSGTGSTSNPILGGDETNWNVATGGIVYNNPYELQVTATQSTAGRKAIWRFHPDAVFVHVEYNDALFAVLNFSANGGGVTTPVSSEASKTNSRLVLYRSGSQDPINNFGLLSGTGTTCASQADGWANVLGESNRYIAVWSSAKESASVLAVDWAELPSTANRAANPCNVDIVPEDPTDPNNFKKVFNGAVPYFDHDPTQKWNYGSGTGEAKDISHRSSGVTGSTPRVLNEGCAMTSVRIPRKGASVQDANYLEFVFRPLLKSGLTTTNAVTVTTGQEAAQTVAKPYFWNRWIFSADSSSLACMPAYTYDTASATYKLSSPTAQGVGGCYADPGEAICFLPEWGGFMIQKSNVADPVSLLVPTSARTTETDWTGGLMGGSPFPQPRFYLANWEPTPDKTAESFFATDASGGREGACRGKSVSAMIPAQSPQSQTQPSGVTPPNLSTIAFSFNREESETGGTQPLGVPVPGSAINTDLEFRLQPGTRPVLKP